MIGERTIDGVPALTLSSDALGGIEAAFAPAAGMVGCSLRHRGEELLGQRRGLRGYIEQRSTMGVPLLHPWANRVAGPRFTVAGREVDLGRAEPPPKLDPNGLPIHGLLAAAPGWRVERHEVTEDGAVLAASFDFGGHPGLVEAFPFPHRIETTVELSGAALSISTAVDAGPEAPVPIAFGYHPYLRLPEIDRAEWRIEAPLRERLELDERGLPTGSRERADVADGRLGERTFDDAFLAPEPGEPFVLAGRGRRIELAFDAGYPFAQLYAPADDDVIAYEPMTAPTNALVSGADLRVLDPDERFEARFTITVG